ncbi:MAG: hypothetical protein ACM359_00985 [Bacillota bacterium]
MLGYIGFCLLLFWTATWMIGVRTRLGSGPNVIFGSLLYTVAAMLLPALGASLLHSWWIIPAVMALACASTYVFAYRTPLLFPLLWLVTSIYAEVIRLGIGKERIVAARREAAWEFLESLVQRDDGREQAPNREKSAA